VKRGYARVGVRVKRMIEVMLKMTMRMKVVLGRGVSRGRLIQRRRGD
jgi:hypothetical protein